MFAKHSLREMFTISASLQKLFTAKLTLRLMSFTGLGLNDKYADCDAVEIALSLFLSHFGTGSLSFPNDFRYDEDCSDLPLLDYFGLGFADDHSGRLASAADVAMAIGYAFLESV